jgi:spermidine synthase
MRFASEGWQGALDKRNPERLLFPYQRYFLVYQAWLDKVDSFLALGVGTGTALRTIRRQHPAAEITGVDLDPVVLQSAVKYFDCPQDDESRLIAMHGRAFLSSDDRKYDLIFHDTYDSQSIPHSMRTLECFSEIRDLLTDDGVLILNVIGARSGPESKPFRALYKTLLHVFTDVWVLPTAAYSWAEQNIVLIARNSVNNWMEPSDHSDPDIRQLLGRLYRKPIPVHDVEAYLDSDN